MQIILPLIITNKRKLLILLMAAFALFSNDVFANNSVKIMKEKARKYYWGIGGMSQDYEKAFDLYLIVANTGDPEAQFIAGAMYNVGRGVEKNIQKSFPLLRDAAKQGKSTVDSEMAIAQAYLLGAGISRDIDMAIDWYSRAAENGSSEAQNELGFIYSSGRYLEENLEKAVYYFKQAAYNGHPVAQYNLGVTYYTGMGQDYDLQKAYAWFEIANVNGHKGAAKSIEELKLELTSTEIEGAHQLAKSIYPKIKEK